MAQVRLDDEVAQWLQQRALDSGRSLSAEANAWLRKAAGLPPGRHSPKAEELIARHDPPPPAQVITPASGQRIGARPFQRHHRP